MAKLFSKAIMASEDIQSYVGSCVLAADVDDGAFVVLGNLKADTIYGVSDVDYNVYEATLATAESVHPVVIDLAEISNGTIAGNNYKMGIKLFDLKGEAGKPVRFRRLALGDKFWLGADNFTSTTANTYGVLAADGKIAFAAAQGNAFAVKIQANKDFNYGTKASGKIYLCEVVAL